MSGVWLGKSSEFLAGWRGIDFNDWLRTDNTRADGCVWYSLRSAVKTFFFPDSFFCEILVESKERGGREERSSGLSCDDTSSRCENRKDSSVRKVPFLTSHCSQLLCT